jgi:hypothetical protein
LGYQLDKESKGMIEIRDISGKPVLSVPFNGMQDQITVTTISWNPGIYTISLTTGGETLETVKFTFLTLINFIKTDGSYNLPLNNEFLHAVAFPIFNPDKI